MIAELQSEIGQWAIANFGHNESKARPCTLTLGSLAPLMGIAEEVGELFASGSHTDAKDALGDIGIYLCDYAYREQIALNALYPTERDRSNQEPLEMLMVSIGKLFHCTLKHHQGIRGFDDLGKYRNAQLETVTGILTALDTLAIEDYSTPYELILSDTWKKIVSKRNWKAAPQSGVEN